MIRANLTSIVALARPMRMVPVEEFDLIIGELEELRRRERERVDLAYEERAAVVAWLRREMQPCSGSVRGTLAYAANEIERGEHRREEEP